MSIEKNTNETFFGALVNLFHALTSYKEDIIELAKLESRLARKSLAWIVVFYCVMAFFFISMWFFLLAALAVWLVAIKFTWLFSLLLVAGFNVLLIVCMLLLIIRFKRYLILPGTRRQLNLWRSKL